MAIKISEFNVEFKNRIKEVIDFAEKEAPDIMGVEAVNHFKESFVNQGFTDDSLESWPEVERRKPESPWHGRSGQTGKFSNTVANNNILTGETRELMNAISYTKTPMGARVINDKVYAHIQNFGGPGKIFGKTPFTMKARQFMGRSKVMKHNMEDKLRREILKILKST